MGGKSDCEVYKNDRPSKIIVRVVIWYNILKFEFKFELCFTQKIYSFNVGP